MQTCIYTHTNTNIHIQRHTMHTHTNIHEYAGSKCTHIHTHSEPIYTLGRSIFRNPPSREHTSVNHHGGPLRLPSRPKSSMVDIATVAAPVKSVDWADRTHPVLTTTNLQAVSHAVQIDLAQHAEARSLLLRRSSTGREAATSLDSTMSPQEDKCGEIPESSESRACLFHMSDNGRYSVCKAKEHFWLHHKKPSRFLLLPLFPGV